MLNAQQRRQLAAMERQLAAEEPDLDRRLRHGLPRRRRWMSSPLSWAVLGSLAVLAGAIELGAVAVVLGLITTVVAVAMPSSAPPPASRPVDPTPP